MALEVVAYSTLKVGDIVRDQSTELKVTEVDSFMRAGKRVWKVVTVPVGTVHHSIAGFVRDGGGEWVMQGSGVTACCELVRRREETSPDLTEFSELLGKMFLL